MPDARGFFAYGADGVLHGIVLILFIFIAFDVMIMNPSLDLLGLPKRTSDEQQPRKIQNFGQTIEKTIFLINTILCLCLVGMALALTVVQPIHLMVSFVGVHLHSKLVFFVPKHFEMSKPCDILYFNE